MVYMIIVIQGRGNAVHSNGVSSAGDGVDEKPYDIRHSWLIIFCQ